MLDAALALIDRVGLDGLTVRGLAEALGRPPMSLYSHFDSKRDLLDLAFEHLLRRLLVAHAHSTWQAELGGSCRQMRRELLAHPHWVALLTRVRVPPTAMHVYDHLLGLMLNDGFRPESAMFAVSSSVSLALGSVLTERLMDGTPPIPKQRLNMVHGMLGASPRASYPSIAAVSSKFDRWNFEHVFEVGLQALIVGLAESRPQTRRRQRNGAAGRR